LDSRDVDGDLQRFRPGHRVPARLVEDPFADLSDQPHLLGNRDEIGRRDQTALRVVPPQESLEPSDAILHQIKKRLKEQFKLVGGKRLAKAEFELSTYLYQRVHFGLEVAEPIATIALRLIERDIGALEPSPGAIAIPILVLMTT
jgi:hypothetical protein